MVLKMVMPSDNPYAPSAMTGEQSQTRVARVSRWYCGVCVLFSVAYAAFTVMLFNSGPGDLFGALLFAFNTPVFLGLSWSAFRSMRVSMWCAIAAAIVQCGITGVMLSTNYGETFIVTGINSAVIAPCLAVAAWAWWLKQAD
jgi:hypothetical protein